jgi:hypothetical protein
MQVKSIVSVVALSAALALSGPAFAQTMVHGMTISEADMARVEALCTDLRNAAGNATAGQNDTDDSTESGDDAETPPAPNAADQALSDVDLAKITLEDCDAGKIGVE